MQFEAGSFSVAGTPSKSVHIQELGFAAFAAHDLPDGMEPNLQEQVSFDPPNFAFPFGTHVAVVEIDTDTGGIELQNYVAVDDCGHQVNPLIVEGQVHGGIVQGVAQALFEEAVYDEDGNINEPVLHGLPRARPPPRCRSMDLDSTVTPSTTNPLGVKGVGEAGTIGSAAAVMNAVCDALQPYGVTDMDMPATPQKNLGSDQLERRCGMIPAAFDYTVAESAEHAIQLLGEYGDESKLLAGGHSLIPMMKYRLATPTQLIDVGRLDDLSYINRSNGHIAIGAMTKHKQLETSDVLAEACPMLAHVASLVGDPSVRHRGTLGGTMAHADSASDLPAAVLALGGTIVAQGPNGQREIAATDFFKSYFESALEPDEMIVEVRVPADTGRLELPEVQPASPRLGDRRRGRRRWREGRGAGQHGLHTVASQCDRSGAREWRIGRRCCCNGG